MSRYFFILVVLISYVNVSFASAEDHNVIKSVQSEERVRRSPYDVECYVCDNCQNTTEQTLRTYCPISPDPHKKKKCIIYAEKYPGPISQGNYRWVSRGCASEKGSCAEIKSSYNSSAYSQLDYCKECVGDRCNGAGQSLPELFFAIFTFVIAPLLGKSILL